jgi:hypothetical protein
MVIDTREPEVLEGQGAQPIDEQRLGLCGRQVATVHSLEQVADLGAGHEDAVGLTLALR